MNAWWPSFAIFAVGLLIGFVAGVVLMALAVAAKDDDVRPLDPIEDE